jgi:tetratricopeptide (TPR) repeat protein
MRKTLALCLLVVAAAAGNALAAAQARLGGKITDAVTHKPIPDVTITVVATERRTFNSTYHGDSKGDYGFLLVDGTIRYKVTFSAPGYQPYEETMKLAIGGQLNERNIEMTPASAVAPADAKASVDPAVVAFNEGATLYNGGKLDDAIVKFQEAVKAKPQMTAAWEALAQAYARKKDWPNAIDAANKALAVAPDESEMYGILYEGYTATGDKAKAAEARKKMPADAGTLFNDAVKLLNANKDAEAEPLLRQSIAADGKFAQSHYELGMLLIRTGKMAEAKTELQKYLELDPNGRDAATARESMKYLK